jgi:hypothetical protein
MPLYARRSSQALGGDAWALDPMTNRIGIKSFVATLHRHQGRLLVGAIATWLVTGFVPKLGLPTAVASRLIALVGWLSIAMFLGYILIKWFYQPQPSAQSLAASKTVKAKEFWAEAARRKRLRDIIAWSWLIAGFPLWALWYFILSPDDPMVAGMAAMATWSPVALWSQWRLWKLKCFNCGKPAIGGIIYSVITTMRCQHCGTPYVAT